MNPLTRTPTSAVVLTTVFCILFTLGGSLGDVAMLTNVGVFLVFFMVNLMLLIHRYRNRGNAASRGRVLALAINIGWFPLLPFLGTAFCALMLLTQFWEPMTVLGISIPIIVFALLIAALAIPLYLLGQGKQEDDALV